MMPAIIGLLELVVGAAKGLISESDAARKVVGIGLDLVPADELRNHLDAEDAARAELAADLAERAKFGG
jgi:hypothetical protein